MAFFVVGGVATALYGAYRLWTRDPNDEWNTLVGEAVRLRDKLPRGDKDRSTLNQIVHARDAKQPPNNRFVGIPISNQIRRAKKAILQIKTRLEL